MSPAISAEHLRRETETTINQRIAGLYADGNTDRGVLTALAVAATEAAEDATYWMQTWLADGASSYPDQIPAITPCDDDRDRMLLAAMTAATNAAALAGVVRMRQRIDRPAGWDPPHLPTPTR